MRNLSLAVLFLTAVTGGFLGCGGGATRKPTTTGSGGKGGSTGTAGTGAAGTTGVAGTTGSAGTGAAGDNGAAGTTGVAGTTGSAGTGAAGDSGAAGTAPPPTCANMAKKALPYAISADFKSTVILHGANTMTAWKMLENPNCEMTVFPPLNPPVDGGVDGGDGGSEAGVEAGVDGGVDGSADGQDAATPDAATDTPVDAPSATDVAVDGSATDVALDVAADGGPTGGTCYGMTYNPDPCVATGAADCWDGVIFAPTAQIGDSAPGICLEEGATKIEFWARSSNPNARIKWGGAWAGPGDDVTEFFFPVTTTWAKYTIASPANKPYNMSSLQAGVWNGFSIVGEPGPHAGGTYIFVKDVKWVK